MCIVLFAIDSSIHEGDDLRRTSKLFVLVRAVTYAMLFVGLLLVYLPSRVLCKHPRRSIGQTCGNASHVSNRRKVVLQPEWISYAEDDHRENFRAPLRGLKEVIRSTGEEAHVQLMLDRPPLSCAADAKIVTAVREATTSVTGQTPEVAGVSHWMDAALFAAVGIATVNYGPSGAGAHEAVEWVDLDLVVSCGRS